ncbi:alpha-mannosidase [Microbacterium sp. TNHR37B]|uniref:alpha-mannosidase n=1 Tax=Microbacterium sp. TNHR37B TaxID=1775956 RepID=UPI0007B267DB|nr:glycoside hydrolase family 38 C-terminal domain-containing protein [Microbacterium sp. TNHR37B]KZE90593.1 Mannosylglycerate hydrolase [Microbacterium sp. TNHR37B]
MTRGSIDDAILRDRVARYLHQRIRPAARRTLTPADVSAWTCADPVAFANAARQQFRHASAGMPWGAPWTTTWLRVEGAAPEAPDGCRVELTIDLGFSDVMPGFQAEGMAYRSDGTIVKAINPTTRWVPLEPGARFDFFIEAAANPVILNVEAGPAAAFAPTSLGDPLTAGSEPQYRLGAIGVEVIDVSTERLAREIEVLTELAWSLPESSARRSRILAAVDAALNALDPGDVRGTAATARALLVPEVTAPASVRAHEIVAVGHAHIDSAWLWPFRETRRKVARTVANVLERMDEDPLLVYAMSSAQQYAWLQQDHPQLFDRLRARVREGRFLPVGGMWVESDVQMPSGESLVRQLLEGSAYFDREFGVPTTIGWLPDSFGYSGALPQLLRSAGATRFVTQKMSWSLVNRFPHHTFAWEGIDGSRVTTHFPSVDTYNSALTGVELAHAAENLAEPELFDSSIAPFGYGDGGGGPTREMLDRARLTADLEGSPRVVVAGPHRFFDRLDAVLAAGRELPIWVGELYLEAQRGVYTSQARTKAVHRRVERLLRVAELWSTQATVREGRPYPAETLTDAWHELLLMQFHDVLPGSSIAWVHREAEERLGRVAARLELVIEEAVAHLTGGGTEQVYVNSSPFPRRGVPAHAIGAIADPQGDRGPVAIEQGAETVTLANLAFEVTVELASGTVTSVIDRARGREVVSAGGRLHLPTLHRDAPVRWDAWDIDSSIDADVETLDAVASLQVRRSEDGAAVVEVERAFGRSRMRQTIELPPGAEPLRLRTRVDWQESERLLKVEFPVAITTDRWQAETQFGHVERPTHRNTSWDEARFEACAHRWVRVAEPGYGVAIVNERTYGFDARRMGDGEGRSWTRLRASLLTSSRYPDPEADRGEHEFAFVIVPAPDPVDAVEAANGVAAEGGPVRGRCVAALACSSEPGVVVETVKMAHDGSGDVIVRLYECRGAHATTALELGIEVRSVVEVDILERPVVGAEPVLDRLEFGPFRVRSFRIATAAAPSADRKEDL